ncbi:hypothetical protein PC118_g3419 [Phytophthora cactorum]|uniref:Protein kinase domain-containing protein n=1 Tax=Phytophthora cactorum TaxID=29920 RepID=A0A8T1GMI0_9STRA|nr:hypothetical protein PC118_g3419 [Phytophthora cactorum]
MPSLGVDALVQQTQVIARCLGWANNTCAFSPVEPVHFSGLDLAQQTVCKADLSVAVKQIDWESPAGGRGSVDSLLVNGVEMLQAPVHPSQSYMIANYPHCNDMFNIFPPWGNGIIGPEGRKSIIPQITTADLPISIHFSWKGPHEVNPVCSMVGVSIAGYVEINIYLEAQDNSDCPGWDDASLTACFGNGKCGCAANDLTPRTCSCVNGYAAPDCRDCASGFFGKHCKRTCEPCLNDGHCDSGLVGTGKCICPEGFNPDTRCATCLPGFYGDKCFDADNNCMECMTSFFGSTCQPCKPCDGGKCNYGLLGDGTEAVCHCDARYGGDGCESYDFPFLMVAILGTIALSTLGFCMCTMRRLARQPHTLHGPFLNRGNSFSQSEYVEISDMADLEYFVSNDSRDWLIPFDSLSLQCEVGNGTSGQVFRSLLHSGGGSSVVAVKRLYSPVTGQEYFQSFFRREVSILSRLHHPYVVRFYGVSYYNRVLYIVTDFCPNSLSGLIENPAAKGPLEEAVFMKVINQIVSGMGFLHSRNVVHRDLKPANVLISETDDVNICDFGLSRLIEPDATTMTAEVGTPSYMAPEMATMGGIQCSTKGDVYSFGILLYSTWSRSKPYGDQGMNPFQLMTAVVNGLRPVIPISCPPALARLMRSCWHQNPDLRPSFPEISQILKDQWLLSMYTEEEEYYYPESPGRVQLMSASSSVSTIPTGATGHGRGSKENVNAMSPFASPRHDGDGYGTYQEAEEEAEPREDDRLLDEEKRPR